MYNDEMKMYKEGVRDVSELLCSVLIVRFAVWI